MRKIWHLSTCDTCRGILCELGGLEGFEKQDIKQDNISAEQLDALRAKVGSYEALFSKQARKYRELGLKDKKLSEADFRKLILEECTFLKRPVIVDGEEIFVGNAPKTVQAAKQKINP